jgi:copper chaperone CopZ
MKKEIVLNIEGMHCPMCAKHVAEALRETSGVKKADVRLEENTARVVYDDAQTSPEQLSAAVAEAGYAVAKGQSS